MAGDQDVEHRVGTQHEGADIAQHAEQGHAEQLRLHSRGAQDSSANDMRPTEA